jgi:hypothetical protein
MSAADFALPAELEAMLQIVCREQNVPERRHDELRALLLEPRAQWPACCNGSCEPCVLEQTSLASEVLARCGKR